MKAVMVIALLALISSGYGAATAKDVTVERIGPRSIAETVMVAGNLQASAPAQVIPQVYGAVSEVYVQEGQEVAAGQPLLQLDTSQLEQAVLNAKASLESTQSLASMFSGLASTASSIGSAVNSALNSVDTGVSNLYELEKLLVPSLPENQRLPALQAIESSYQQYLARASNRPSFGAGGGGSMSTGAQEAAAAKSIENAEKNLQAATIVAPASGTLVGVQSSGTSLTSMMSTLMSSFSSMIPSGLNLSALSGLSGGIGNMGLPSGGPPVPGTYVMPGSPIFQVVDLKSMSMVAKVDESDIAKVQLNQEATMSLEAFPGKKFHGTVVKIADVATTNEAGATAFEVTMRMDQADINLKIGMTGTADVTIAAKKTATVVPLEAVVEKNGKKYVFKVVDGKAHLTPVTLGLTTESSVEVIQGVRIGDRVVVKGVEKLKDGQGVKI
jgi:multidrug efflux pump subunit AcrA (membrane-fusion protein)